MTQYGRIVLLVVVLGLVNGAGYLWYSQSVVVQRQLSEQLTAVYAESRYDDFLTLYNFSSIDNPDAIYKYALTLIRYEQFADAMPVLLKVQHQAADPFLSVLIKGVGLLINRRYEAVTSLVESYETLHIEERSFLLLLGGIAHYSLGNYYEALELLESAYQLDPTSPIHNKYLGLTHARLNRALSALTYFDQVSNGYFSGYLLDAEFFLYKGIALYQNDQYREAFTEIMEALNRDPNNSLGYSYMARIAADKGMYQQAVSLIDRAINQDPDNGLLYRIKGGFYLQQEAYENALSNFELAYAEEQDTDILVDQMFVWHKLNNPEEVRRLIVTIESAIPENIHKLAYFADKLVAIGEYQLGVRYAKQALAINNKNHIAKNAWINSFVYPLLEGLRDESLRDSLLEDFRSIFATEHIYLFYQGLVLALQGDETDALMYFQGINPSFERQDGLYALALYYMYEGEFGLARNIIDSTYLRGNDSTKTLLLQWKIADLLEDVQEKERLGEMIVATLASGEVLRVEEIYAKEFDDFLEYLAPYY